MQIQHIAQDATDVIPLADYVRETCDDRLALALRSQENGAGTVRTFVVTDFNETDAFPVRNLATTIPLTDVLFIYEGPHGVRYHAIEPTVFVRWVTHMHTPERYDDVVDARDHARLLAVLRGQDVWYLTDEETSDAYVCPNARDINDVAHALTGNTDPMGRLTVERFTRVGNYIQSSADALTETKTYTAASVTGAHQP